MPKVLQVALTRAAFLGPSRFDAEILLQTISAQERKDAVGRDDGEGLCNAGTVLEDTLVLGVKEGLLEKLRLPRIYKFSHDRIKESAYALVPDGNARKHLHWTTTSQTDRYQGCRSRDASRIPSILARDTSDEPRIGMIISLFQEGDTAGARDLTLRVLDQLGIHIPRILLKLNIAGRMLRTRRRLRCYSDDDIMAFPEKADESTMLAAAFVALLSEMSSLSANNDYLFFSVLEAIRIAINGSKNDWTAMALAASGLIFVLTGEIDAAYRHWRHSYHECLEGMLRAYKIAVDIEYLFFSILGYSVTYYQCGLQLFPIAKDMRRFRDLLEDYGQTYYLSIFQTQVQFILNLMETCDDPTVLTGEAMDQKECLQLWSKTPNPRAMCHLTLNRMHLAYFFGDLPLAEKMASELCHPLEFGPVPWLALRFFFEGLICFGLAKSNCHRRRYQRRGFRFLRRLEKIVRGGNINCHHMMLLLRAEHIALTSHSDPGMVQRAYGDAITAAGKLGFMHHQAIGNELAGAYFLEQQNDKAWACTYLSRARALFELWGAQAKVRHMETKYKELAIQPANSKMRSSTIMSRTRFDEMPVDSGLINLYMQKCQG